MARAVGKKRRQQTEIFSSFLFEIESWQAEYALSIGNKKSDDDPYREQIDIEIKATCLAPKRWAGRPATFVLMGDRKLMQSEPHRHDPGWWPSGVAALHLRPSSGSFYAFMPYDAMPFLLTAFAAGQFRYVDLWGPELKRSSSRCRSVRLLRTIEPDDYPELASIPAARPQTAELRR